MRAKYPGSGCVLHSISASSHNTIRNPVAVAEYLFSLRGNCIYIYIQNFERQSYLKPDVFKKRR